MPTRTLANFQDFQDFITGLKLLGTGGGGSPTAGMEMLTQAHSEGLSLGWIDAAELPDEAFSCTTYGSGSISEDTPGSLEEIHELGRKRNIPVRYAYRAPEIAIRELEAYAGVRIGAIVPVELGASNTIAPLVTAARLGLPLVDGDYSGRAVPQDMQSTYFLKGVPAYPAAIVDWWGNVIILKEVVTAEMGERIGKMLGVAAFGVVYFANTLLSAEQTRDTIIPGTLTLSLELGQAVHRAVETGRDPIAEIVRKLEGWLLFQGVVVGKEWQDKEGVMVGTTFIQGTGAFSGKSMKVWFLNENHVCWLDEQPYVFSPDLIILANPNTGEGYTNTEIKKDDPVVVLGAKAHPIFRTERALQYFAPRYWGFDFDYVPIEERMRAK
ncbi:MAG: DUF917 domain-containing protein [Anaerolineales bacterium]|nr:DUF917 domain-containing protein [Anaerolineales bacterium]MCS7248917.1 DUF917 domain-containing protein [Anaerolineales bacterium]MDW8162730.1 DUF917 domain-containing protein [Anaerolineales bacterium]MDW8447116.1 DUF917 domain-containing protein [Anaerolineales bacterium]